MKNNRKIIDTEYLKSVSSNNDFLKKIFSLFKEDALLYKEKMPELLNKEKYSELAELVHKAKSGTAILGMKKQSEEMKRLENDIRNKTNTETFKKRIDNFLSDCSYALKEIEQIETAM